MLHKYSIGEICFSDSFRQLDHRCILHSYVRPVLHLKLLHHIYINSLTTYIRMCTRYTWHRNRRNPLQHNRFSLLVHYLKRSFRRSHTALRQPRRCHGLEEKQARRNRRLRPCARRCHRRTTCVCVCSFQYIFLPSAPALTSLRTFSVKRNFQHDLLGCLVGGMHNFAPAFASYLQLGPNYFCMFYAKTFIITRISQRRMCAHIGLCVNENKV